MSKEKIEQLATDIVYEMANLNNSNASFNERCMRVEALLAGHIKPDTNIEDADLQEAIELLKNANNSSSFFKSAKEFTEKYSPKPKFGPFSLEKYTTESIVKTVDGRDVRILCTDRLGAWPIVGLIRNPINEFTTAWSENGKCNDYGNDNYKGCDLMIQEQDSGTKIEVHLFRHNERTNVLAVSLVKDDAPRGYHFIKTIKTRV